MKTALNTALMALAIACLLLVPNPVFAEQKIEVISLDMGECWARPLSRDDKTPWAVASFNDGRSFFVTPDDQLQVDSLKFQTKLTSALKALGFQNFAKADVEYDLECSGSGMSIRIKVNDLKTPLCVWARPGGSNIDLEITDVYPNPGDTADDVCEGVTAGRLLAGLTDASTDRGGTLETLKTSLRYAGIISDAKPSAAIPDMLKITLTDQWKFHEAEVRQLIKSDPALKGKLKYVDYDRRASISGEGLELFTDTFPGF
jgi:hypothetical protein